MISAPAKIETSNVDDLVGQMVSAYEKDREAPLGIDLHGVQSISRPAGAVLVNALVTELNAATLALKEPERSPIPKLTHSGLGFAFANREGKTTFQHLTDAE
ncbi:MAG: hypothetical protein AB7T06_37510, partial [Kofleriaceae bacterium]